MNPAILDEAPRDPGARMPHHSYTDKDFEGKYFIFFFWKIKPVIFLRNIFRMTRLQIVSQTNIYKFCFVYKKNRYSLENKLFRHAYFNYSSCFPVKLK